MATKKSADKKSSGGRKYGQKAQEKVKEELHAMKEGKLRSGSGQKVKNPKQAIAIGLSEARAEGGKVPAPAKRSSSAKKGTKKSTPQKTSSKKGSGHSSSKKSSARSTKKKSS